MSPEVGSLRVEDQPTYNLSLEQAQASCAEFLNSQENRPKTRFGCYLISGSDEYSNLGRFVEGQVFMDTFGNTPDVMETEYGPFEKASTFFVVVDHEANLPVGVMRIIENSEAGLKSLVDLERTPLKLKPEEVYEGYNIDPGKCVDLGTLAVLPQYRGPAADFIPASLTYRTLFLTVLDNPKFEHVVTIVDENALRNLQFFKFPFQPIFNSEALSYLDSPNSYAMIAQNSAFYPEVTLWAEKLREQSQWSGNARRLWQATMMDSFINGGPMDEMLGFAKEDNILRKS